MYDTYALLAYPTMQAANLEVVHSLAITSAKHRLGFVYQYFNILSTWRIFKKNISMQKIISMTALVWAITHW